MLAVSGSRTHLVLSRCTTATAAYAGLLELQLNFRQYWSESFIAWNREWLICFHTQTGSGRSSVSTQAQTKSMVLNRIKHPQVRATSKYSSVSWSAPQEVCARTRSRFRAFVHLSFKCFMCFMCGMKDSLRSKTTPRNLVSSTTGTGVPFSRRVGSGWGLRNSQKCMHMVLEREYLNPLVSAQSASLLRHRWRWRSIIWICLDM